MGLGDEPMAGAQASYLKTLSEECDEPEAFAPDLTTAEASQNAAPCGTGNRDEPARSSMRPRTRSRISPTGRPHTAIL
jgi:DUF3072 family protein